jgi:hypothetical protein
MSQSTSLLLDALDGRRLRKLLELAVRAEDHGPRPAGTRRPPDPIAALGELLRRSGRSHQALLTAVTTTTTPLRRLRDVKEVAKQLERRAPSASHRDAAKLLYHAAVAAAFAWHGENISSRHIRSRLGLYDHLASTLHDSELAAVFRATVARASSAPTRGHGPGAT